jgi:hypothetical protein
LRKNEGGEEKGLPQSDPLHASVIDQCNHGQIIIIIIIRRKRLAAQPWSNKTSS